MTAPDARRSTTVVATTAATLAVVVTVVTVLFSWGRPSADGFGDFGAASAIRVAAYCAYALVGAFVAARRPGNAVAWVFVVGGTAMTLQLGLEEYAHAAVVLEPGRWPATVAVDWVAEWLWVLPMTALQFSTLLFPSGALPTRRWRPVAAVLLVGDLLLLVLVPVATWPFRGRLAGDMDLLPSSPLWAVVEPLAVAMAVSTVLCALSLIVRYRRADGEERYQLRWVVWAGIALVVGASVENVFGVSAVAGGSSEAVWPAAAGALGTVALPVAAGFAILKRRLYDIDRIVGRVLGYTLASVLLVATYLASVLVLGTATRSLTGESGDLVVALSTLAAAAVARPLLTRVRAFVDRRFDRARYDAARTVEAFGRSLRDEVSRDAVVGALRATASRALAPTRVGVHLTTRGTR